MASPTALAIARWAYKVQRFRGPLSSLSVCPIRCFGSDTEPTRPSVRKVLVVGAGAIGLRTALELIHRNVDVVLHAPRHPLHPSTCSMGAGGLWMPFHVEDDRVDRWAKQTLDELWDYQQNTSMVEIVPAIQLKRGNNEFNEDGVVGASHEAVTALPTWSRDNRLDFSIISTQTLGQKSLEYKLRIPPETELKTAGYQYAWFFWPPIVDTPRMLEHLLSEVRKKAVEVNVDTNEYFQTIKQMQEKAVQLSCDTVVNCTGLGAASICKDDKLVGARGILLQFERATCVRRPAGTGTTTFESGHNNLRDTVIMTEEAPWGSETMPCYLIPRGDVVVVGGSYLEGDTETLLRDEERQQLLVNATRLGIDVERSKIVGEWTGFRPFRPSVRCELENINDDVQVFHSYGYGGSGWTVNVGAAKECADILLGKQFSR